MTILGRLGRSTRRARPAIVVLSFCVTTRCHPTNSHLKVGAKPRRNNRRLIGGEPSAQAAEFKNNSALRKPKGPVAIAEGGLEISNADERQMSYADAGFSYGDHGAVFEVLTTLFQHADQKIRELFGFQPFDADANHGGPRCA